MTDFIYNPATGYFEQFQGDVPDDAIDTDAATHHTLLSVRANGGCCNPDGHDWVTIWRESERSYQWCLHCERERFASYE